VVLLRQNAEVNAIRPRPSQTQGVPPDPSLDDHRVPSAVLPPLELESILVDIASAVADGWQTDVDLESAS
jgi:hypothetical protein